MWCSAIGCIVTLTPSLLAVPFAANAQPVGKIPRIGFLSPGAASEPRTGLEGFRQGLRNLGYIEGQHLAIEAPNVEQDEFDQRPSLAAELVRFGVDMLIAADPEAFLRAVCGATSTLPIVMIAIDYDPMALGYIAGLPRPGGNITGLFLQQLELTPKRPELLEGAVPTINRVTEF
jgi:putative tryptophan/tyrosine transport system substrate-binding protein